MLVHAREKNDEQLKFMQIDAIRDLFHFFKSQTTSFLMSFNF